MNETYVLSNGKLYFAKWVPIGPMFTDKLEEAMHYCSRRDAMLDSSRHFAFLDYAPYAIGSQAAAELPQAGHDQPKAIGTRRRNGKVKADEGNSQMPFRL